MGLIDLGVRYRGQAMDTMGGIARRETERVNFNRKLAAQEKAGRWNAAGQGLGLGYMGYQTGALGKAAETVGASPGVVDFLTPAKTGAETAAANAAQQGGNAIQATRALNTPGVPSGYAPDPGSLGNVPMPAGSGATPAPTPTPTPTPAVGGGAATTGAGQAASAPTLGSMAEGTGIGTGTIGGAISGGSMGGTVGSGIGTAAFGAGGAAGGAVGGTIGGGLGGALGGTVAAPLSAMGSGLSAVGATTAGGALSGAAGAITGSAAAGGAAAGAGVGSALSSLGALILAF